MKLKILFALIVLSVLSITASAQNARLDFDRLNYLESKASEVVEVNVEGKMLDLAKRVLTKSKDVDAQKVAEAVKGLQGIYVRVYNFDKEQEYNEGDVDAIRAQLRTPGWEKLVNVRSKRENQKIDVFTMFTGDTMSGVAVVLSEAKSIAVVNVIGPIDIDLLVELSGKLSIPRIDVEKTKTNE